MSLSKFFKKTELFQAEKLNSTVTPIADWKAHDLLHKEQKDSFSPYDFSHDATTRASFEQMVQKEMDTKNDDSPAPSSPSGNTDNTITQENAQRPPHPTAPLPSQVAMGQEEVDRKIATAFEQGKKEGFSEGYKKGHAEGLIQGQSETSPQYESIISALTVVFQQVETYRDNIVQNSAKEMREATLAFVEKIVRFSVKHNDATILLTLEEALQHAIKSSEFSIQINPEDYDVVQENSESFIATISGLESIVLKKNAAIERGGAYIESDNCIVDATISSQLEELYNTFKLSN